MIEAASLYEVRNPVPASTTPEDVIFYELDITDNDPLVDWNFITQPQSGVLNKIGLHFARARCLGGSSAQNFMISQRLTAHNLEERADAVNDPPWTLDNVFPYCKWSCKFTPPTPTK